MRAASLVIAGSAVNLRGLAAFQFLADDLADRRLHVGLVQRGLQGLIDQRLVGLKLVP